MTPTQLYGDPNQINWDLPVVIDFESYYDEEWSLSKITTEQYIRGDQWECIGVSIKVGEKPAKFYRHETGLPVIAELVNRLPTSPFVSHNCLTGDHEVRTETGWKRLDELDGTEKILQWQPDTGEAEFVPYKPFNKLYSGRVYEYNTNFHKGIYTADHRVYFQNAYSMDYKVDTAENVSKRQPNGIYLPTGFVVVGNEKDSLFTPTEIMLLEAIRADAYRVSRRSVLFHVSKQRKVERVKYISDLLGLKCTVSLDVSHEREAYNVSVTGGIVETICNLLGRDKNLDKWVLDLAVETRLAWLNELEYWDGSRTTKHCVTVATANKNNAYWLSELALFTGWQGYVRYDCPNTRGFSKSNGVLHFVTVRNKQRVKFVERPTVYDYDGMVYCVSVPSKAFVVRRNGKVWVTGNCSFDMAILGLRYGIHPNFMVDTAIMAKLCGLDRVAGGTSLAKLSDQLEKMGLVNKVKGTTVHNMRGVHAADMSEQQWQEYGDYCVLDSDLCHALYMYMIDKVPTQELIMADITTKMYTKPMFDIDVPLLQDYAVRLETERDGMLGRIAGQLGFKDNKALLSNLRSSKKFVALLERLGVEVPMKWSEKQEKMIPAVSKTDLEFLELLEHDDELVRTLVETKLGTMSSMEQTRTATFLDIASRGRMPIPLRYASAHTGRYGGCFAADTKVLCLTTDQCIVEKNIVDVLLSDLVWDGEEWCEHSGVEFNGYQEVITYDGLTGTKNHRVFIDETTETTLFEAMRTGTPIMDCKLPPNWATGG